LHNPVHISYALPHYSWFLVNDVLKNNNFNYMLSIGILIRGLLLDLQLQLTGWLKFALTNS